MDKVKAIDIHLNKKVTVFYGIDIEKEFISVLSDYSFDKVFFISDTNAYELHGESLIAALTSNQIIYHVIHVTAREENKSFRELEKLCNQLIEMEISKDSIIIGFGGGMACNLIGLAAALVYRGIRYIEIPTTYMGQTDSAISNKQAVNGDFGKNQFGTYYAPLFIWADLSYITTEDIRHIRAAFVEAIKNGFIYDKEILNDLSQQLYENQYSAESLLALFEKIVNSKNKILAQDTSEEKYAVILEYGHTLGHAIEFLTHGEIIHGEAVAIGMCIIADVSHALSYLSEEELDLHYKLLLPYLTHTCRELFVNLDINTIMSIVQKDNKRRSSGIRYVVLEHIGECLHEDDIYQIEISEQMIKQAIQTFQERLRQVEL